MATKTTERDILDQLHRRYGRTTMGARRYAVAEHVRNRPFDPVRIADFIAVDNWKTGGYALHGHEVKVSRSDWLTELRAPEKAEVFKRHMDYWWLVVSDRSIVRPGELPTGWGLLISCGPYLQVSHLAPRLEPEPMPRELLVSLTRSVSRTAAGDAFGRDWDQPEAVR